MEHLFKRDTIDFDLNRRENVIHLSISADYSQSDRKSQLYVNGKRLAEQLESTWKRITTTKLKSIRLSFYEIDWYDDMTDIYNTPIVSIKKGLRKAKIDTNEHGSIPKEWGVQVDCKFEDLQTKKPILDTIKEILGSKFTTEMEKDFVKKYNPIIANKKVLV
jgi:hypothetical protein